MSVESAEYAAVDATLRSTQWTAIFIAVNAANDISYDATNYPTSGCSIVSTLYFPQCPTLLMPYENPFSTTYFTTKWATIMATLFNTDCATHQPAD